MSERIEKKLAQIKKIEKRIAKHEARRNENGFKKEYSWVIEREGYEKTFARLYEDYLANVDVEIKRATRDLAEANAQLEKIQRQEEVKKAKEDTLNDMPETMKKFAEEMEKIWNEYDKNERDFLKDEYKKLGYKEFIKKYKFGYQKLYKTDEEIKKENKRAIDSLILNLLNRVIEKTGKITDAAGLKVTRGNGGYAVINGAVIGEKGRAVVESIGAGGYNIQRYHVRTLVK